MIQTDCWRFCDEILPDVSRSFALIIPRCPEPIDRALCVAYLICRAADTVEDEASLTDDQRQHLYDRLLATVDEPGDAGRWQAFRQAWPSLPEQPYTRLIDEFDQVLTAYASLPHECIPPIRTCVHDMVGGMRRVRPVTQRGGVAFICEDLGGLDRYCHHVAGTVGLMSTGLFETRFGTSFQATDTWREEGRRLGLGLQMTNIVKDCRVDAERGISYIPAECLDPGADAYMLSDSGRRRLIEQALGHLDAGMHYVLTVPAEETGIRVFLLGSLLPALATLEVAAPGTEYHPKIERPRMMEIFVFAEKNAGDDRVLEEGYEEGRRRVLDALAGF